MSEPAPTMTASSAGARGTPLARSPISPAPPVVEVAGWEISGRTSTAALTLTDETPLAKVQVKAAVGGAVAEALGVGHGRAATDDHGALVVGSGPGEWLVLAAPGTASAVADRLRRTSGEVAPGEFVTVTELTHGRAVMRLAGRHSADVLAKLCAIDFSEQVTPPWAAFRTSVAKLVTDVIYQSRDRERSYVMHCERSSGQYLFDALLDAGSEFGIDIDGFRPLDH